MPPKIVRELKKEYRKNISAHERELNQINRLLIGRTLKYLFPGIEKRRFRKQNFLRADCPKKSQIPTTSGEKLSSPV
jgi:hypothetical protein